MVATEAVRAGSSSSPARSASRSRSRSRSGSVSASRLARIDAKSSEISAIESEVEKSESRVVAQLLEERARLRAARQKAAQMFIEARNYDREGEKDVTKTGNLIHLRDSATGASYQVFITGTEIWVPYHVLLAQIASELHILPSQILGLLLNGRQLEEDYNVNISQEPRFKVQLEPGAAVKVKQTLAGERYAQMKAVDRHLAAIEARIFQLSNAAHSRGGLLLVHPDLDGSKLVTATLRRDLVHTAFDRFKTIGLLVRILGTTTGITRIRQARDRKFETLLNFECDNRNPVSATLIQEKLHIGPYAYGSSTRVGVLIDPLKVKVLGAFKEDALSMNRASPKYDTGDDGKVRYENFFANYARIQHLKDKYGAEHVDGTVSGLLSKLAQRQNKEFVQRYNEVIVSPITPGTNMRAGIIGVFVFNPPEEGLQSWLAKEEIRTAIENISPGLPIFTYDPVASSVAFVNAGGRRGGRA